MRVKNAPRITEAHSKSLCSRLQLVAWNSCYSHSTIANLKYMLYRVILLLLFQEVPCRANHFVIGRGDYKMRFLLPFHLICDYSLATTPIFTKGSGHRWFSTGAHAVSDTAIGGCKPCALGGFLPDFCQERKAENILFMG